MEVLFVFLFCVHCDSGWTVARVECLESVLSDVFQRHAAEKSTVYSSCSWRLRVQRPVGWKQRMLQPWMHRYMQSLHSKKWRTNSTEADSSISEYFILLFKQKKNSQSSLQNELRIFKFYKHDISGISMTLKMKFRWLNFKLISWMDYFWN